MITTGYIRLMAAYAHWQNDNLFSAAAALDDAARRADRGAFFGSIHATLNHQLWGDQVWLHRLAGTAPPGAPDIPGSVAGFESWEALRAARAETDRDLLDWARRVRDEDLAGDMTWFSGAVQAELTRPRAALVIQLFNHGTHHRGQVHAMLTAAGARPSDTDVQFLPDDRYPW